jgi:phage FluMu protein Com
MEKIETCTLCNKRFVVKGNVGDSKEVAQDATCPYCQELNEVMWPMNDGYSVFKFEERGS